MSSLRAFIACLAATAVIYFGTRADDQTFPSSPQTTYATTHVGGTP